MIDSETLSRWKTQARRDDWHMLLVGSDIRQMIGEIERLNSQVDNYMLAATGLMRERDEARAAAEKVADEMQRECMRDGGSYWLPANSHSVDNWHRDLRRVGEH